jgi:hypothetical protein
MSQNNINDLCIYYDWSPTKLLEIQLPDPDSFLKIKETLTRIGVASKKDPILWASCAILHRQGKYYILHFKELFALDGKSSDISVDDIARRNTIAKLLEQWGLCKIVTTEQLHLTNLSNIKVIPYKEKQNWELRSKYTMRSERKPKAQ